MHPGAGHTGHGFKSIFAQVGWVVGDPALHIQARIGTSVEKSFHKSIDKTFWRLPF
jgi:hypothetical protein